MSHHRRETDSPDISLLSCSRLVTPSCISYYLLLSIGTQMVSSQSLCDHWFGVSVNQERNGKWIPFYFIWPEHWRVRTRRQIYEKQSVPRYWRGEPPPPSHCQDLQAYKDEAMLRPVTRDLWDCQVSLLRAKDQIHSTTFNVIFLKYVCIYHKYKSVSYKLTWFDLTIIYWFITSVDHSDNYDSAARKCWYLPWLASYISAKRRSIMSWCLKH